MFRTMTVSALALAASITAAYARTEIQWWHAMGGELGTKLEEIVKKYNESQDQFTVVPSFKGTYAETMTAAIAAFRAKEQPAIVQVFEVGTGTMMAAKGAIYPVYQLMADQGAAFDPKAFLPAVVGYYTDTDGNMLSMPFNSSTPILYYNKNVFEKAGLDPNAPPRTWEEVESFSKKIMDSGAAKCGFTTGWISWVQLENFSAWHNQPIGTLENGFGGLGSELTVNGPVQAKHWANLKKWQDEGVFQYGGPVGGNDAPPKFYSQECAIYMNSSASRAGVLANTKDFEVGYGMLRYYSDVPGARRTRSSAVPRSGCSRAGRPRNTRAWPTSSTTCPRPRCRPTGASSRAICRSPRPPMTWARARASTTRTPAPRSRSSRSR